MSTVNWNDYEQSEPILQTKLSELKPKRKRVKPWQLYPLLMGFAALASLYGKDSIKGLLFRYGRKDPIKLKISVMQLTRVLSQVKIIKWFSPLLPDSVTVTVPTLPAITTMWWESCVRRMMTPTTQEQWYQLMKDEPLRVMTKINKKLFPTLYHQIRQEQKYKIVLPSLLVITVGILIVRKGRNQPLKLPLVPLDKEKMLEYLPKVKEITAFTSRSQDTLPTLRSRASQILNEMETQQKWKLTSTEKYQMILFAVKEAQIPDPLEMEAVDSLMMEKAQLWKMYDSIRKGGSPYLFRMPFLNRWFSLPI